VRQRRTDHVLGRAVQVRRLGPGGDEPGENRDDGVARQRRARPGPGAELVGDRLEVTPLADQPARRLARLGVPTVEVGGAEHLRSELLQLARERLAEHPQVRQVSGDLVIPSGRRGGRGRRRVGQPARGRQARGGKNTVDVLGVGQLAHERGQVLVLHQGLTRALEFGGRLGDGRGVHAVHRAQAADRPWMFGAKPGGEGGCGQLVQGLPDAGAGAVVHQQVRLRDRRDRAWPVR
jgi:hypothetical protein